jgi:hypothetical protein
MLLVGAGCVSTSMIKEQKRLNEKLDALASQMMKNDSTFDSQHYQLFEHTEEVCKPRMF